jgi:translocation and assembly module TamB
MEVSRNFFDERVRVTVGGNIELEDETQQRELTDIAGDVNIEYMLTPRGNLILRGFRKRDFARIPDGEVTETGVALMFSRSYNRFRDLFKREEEQAVEVPETDTNTDTEEIP